MVISIYYLHSSFRFGSFSMFAFVRSFVCWCKTRLINKNLQHRSVPCFRVRALYFIYLQLYLFIFRSILFLVSDLAHSHNKTRCLRLVRSQWLPANSIIIIMIESCE